MFYYRRMEVLWLFWMCHKIQSVWRTENFVLHSQSVPLWNINCIYFVENFSIGALFRKVSHPGMAYNVAKEVAKLKGLRIEEVLDQTRKNTRTIYGIWMLYFLQVLTSTVIPEIRPCGGTELTESLNTMWRHSKLTSFQVLLHMQTHVLVVHAPKKRKKERNKDFHWSTPTG